MRFPLDHEAPADLGLSLRTVGYECVRLVDVLDRTATDQDVWAHACAHACVLITCNRNDFLALATATSSHPGLIIVMRRRTRHERQVRNLLPDAVFE